METLTKPPAEQMMPPQIDTGNQDPLAKLEFEGIDPRFSDVVYHFTPEENLEAIGKEGLRYSDRYDETWSRAEGLLMDAKPADIAVDLKHTVFAQLEQGHLGTINGSGALRTDLEKGESIAVAVDPNDTYVGDAAVRENHTASVRGERSRMLGIYEPPEVRKEFWGGVMPLSKFRELYKPSEYGDLIHWELKDPDNFEKLGVPEIFGKPELYIPLEAGEDAIPAERLAHTASSLSGRIESAEEVRKRERKEKTKRLGELGIQLADLYEGYQDATKRVIEAKSPVPLQDAERMKELSLRDASDLLTHPAYEDRIRQEAIDDANAAGHDINFGGQHYPAESSEEERKVA